MKKLSDYQAIIVDLDGTLYYQKPVRIAMLKTMLLHFWRFRDFLIIKRYRELFERGLNKQERLSRLPENAPSVVQEWMIKRALPYLTRYRDNALISLLNETKKNGKTIIVYSDYPVIEKLAAVGFTPDQAYSSNDVGCMKPNPDGIIRILQTQGLNPGDCIVIGDREEKDGALARNMGANALILPANEEERKEIYHKI